jgi:hypothetical protein
MSDEAGTWLRYAKGKSLLTIQVAQIMLRREGLLRPWGDEGAVRGQASPCTLPGIRQSYTSGHGDAVV